MLSWGWPGCSSRLDTVHGFNTDPVIAHLVTFNPIILAPGVGLESGLGLGLGLGLDLDPDVGLCRALRAA